MKPRLTGGTPLRILVTGEDGQLGYEVTRLLKAQQHPHLGTTRQSMDLCDAQQVSSVLEAFKPDAVIHCAAYTAVDKAQSEQALCHAINVEGTRLLAQYCHDHNAKMIYISTDYVFDGTGDSPIEVDHPTGPLSVYGTTKLQGEQAARALVDQLFIVRTTGAFGIGGSNFVKTMLRLADKGDPIKVVSDQIISPTYVLDLAALLVKMIQTPHYGTYHATNEGFCSWYEFAQEIFRQAGKQVTMSPITTKDYPTAAARPLNSRLSKAALDTAGFNRLPSWQDALGRYLKELGI